MKSNKYLIEYFGLTIDNKPIQINELPVYFKVDLIRLIILLQLVKKNPNQYAIYADFDTKPLSQKEIFTINTIKVLEKYGLVLPEGQLQEYENSFHILAGEKLTCDKYMRLSIDKILIEIQFLIAFTF